MSRNGTHTRAMLDAWRDQGADRMDPVRFHRIDALERRAVGHDGEVRRVLDARLSELIGAYAGDLERTAAQAVDADGSARPGASTHGAMGELLDYIARQTVTRGDGCTVDDTAPCSSFPELAALNDIRKLWTRIRAESQLRQSLEQAPVDAGPLNSGRLVHRSLTLMRELSPGYLQPFLSYVDALTWLERMNDDGVLAVEGAPRAASNERRGRDKPRRRKA